MSDSDAPKLNLIPNFWKFVASPLVTAIMVLLAEHYLNSSKPVLDARLSMQKEIVLRQRPYLLMAIDLAKIGQRSRVYIEIQRTHVMGTPSTGRKEPNPPLSVLETSNSLTVPVIAADSNAFNAWKLLYQKLDTARHELDRRIVEDIDNLTELYWGNPVPIPFQLEIVKRTRWVDSSFIDKWQIANDQLYRHAEQILLLE